MKRILPLILLLIITSSMLLSCGLSATQIENNLKNEGYVSTKWDEEKIQEKFPTLWDKEEYKLTSAFSGALDGENKILVVQLETAAQARHFASDVNTYIEDELILVNVEGRLVLIGQLQELNIALGKVQSTNTDSSK